MPSELKDCVLPVLKNAKYDVLETLYVITKHGKKYFENLQFDQHHDVDEAKELVRGLIRQDLGDAPSRERLMMEIISNMEDSITEGLGIVDSIRGMDSYPNQLKKVFDILHKPLIKVLKNKIDELTKDLKTSNWERIESIINLSVENLEFKDMMIIGKLMDVYILHRFPPENLWKAFLDALRKMTLEDTKEILSERMQSPEVINYEAILDTFEIIAYIYPHISVKIRNEIFSNFERLIEEYEERFGEIFISAFQDLLYLNWYIKRIDYIVNDIKNREFKTCKDAENLEEILVSVLIDVYIADLDKRERTELMRELGKSMDGVNKAMLQALGGYISLVMLRDILGFTFHKMLAIVVNRIAKMLVGRGLSIAANALLQRMAAIFLGPIGWLITLILSIPLITSLLNPRRIDRYLPAVLIIYMLRNEEYLEE